MSINWKQTIEFYYSRIIYFHNLDEKCNYIRLKLMTLLQTMVMYWLYYWPTLRITTSRWCFDLLDKYFDSYKMRKGWNKQLSLSVDKSYQFVSIASSGVVRSLDTLTSGGSGRERACALPLPPPAYAIHAALRCSHIDYSAPRRNVHRQSVSLLSLSTQYCTVVRSLEETVSRVLCSCGERALPGVVNMCPFFKPIGSLIVVGKWKLDLLNRQLVKQLDSLV